MSVMVSPLPYKHRMMGYKPVRCLIVQPILAQCKQHKVENLITAVYLHGVDNILHKPNTLSRWHTQLVRWSHCKLIMQARYNGCTLQFPLIFFGTTASAVLMKPARPAFCKGCCNKPLQDRCCQPSSSRCWSNCRPTLRGFSAAG